MLSEACRLGKFTDRWIQQRCLAIHTDSGRMGIIRTVELLQQPCLARRADSGSIRTVELLQQPYLAKLPNSGSICTVKLLRTMHHKTTWDILIILRFQEAFRLGYCDRDISSRDIMRHHKKSKIRKWVSLFSLPQLATKISDTYLTLLWLTNYSSVIY